MQSIHQVAILGDAGPVATKRMLGHPVPSPSLLKKDPSEADTDSMEPAPSVYIGDPAAHGRHICCSMTSVLLRVVRSMAGESGVSETLRAADSTHDVAFLDNLENWISLEEANALLQAGVEVTGDTALPRRVGEETLRQHAGTQVATLLRSLGSPEAVLRQVTTAAAKFSTISELAATETSESGAVVLSRPRPGFTRSKLMCDYTQGLLSQCCVLFGMPPARVDEIECQAEGAPHCRYVVSWDFDQAQAAADPEQRVRALETQVVALTQRLESAYATARDLVSPDDLDTILLRIVERAADAVRAPAYVLSAQLEPGGQHSVFCDGVPVAEAAELAASTGHEHASNMLCVEVASSRRQYGRLIALYPSGQSFFAHEQQLLGLYGKHAAAVLDTALALREAARRNEHVTALLSLSQVLAGAETTSAVARELSEAVLNLVDCDVSSVWLWDRERERLRHEWTAGAATPSFGRALELDPEALLLDPRPRFTQEGEQDGLLGAMMVDPRLVALAAVPVISHGVLLALLSAGVAEGPERLRFSPELTDKLAGVAALAAPTFQNRQLIDELGRQVIHDALTGVLNRTGFVREIERTLSGGLTQGPAGLLFVDLDRFKDLNDRHGHQAGDEVLRQAALRLRETTRGGDVVARLGGDEFAIFLRRPSGAEEVSLVAGRVEQGFAEPFLLGDVEARVGASVGEAYAPPGATLDDLIRMADASMYVRKSHRRAASGDGTPAGT